jgi:integrase
VNFNPFSSQKKEELIMGIKQDKDGTYIVAYSKRHPQTRSPVVMRRKGIKSKAEANRVLAELIIIVSDKLKKVITPAWPKLLGNYLKFLDESEMTKMTCYGRRKSLEKYTLPLWSERSVDEISTQDIHGILRERFQDKAEAHKKYFIKCIRGVFQYVVSESFLWCYLN